MDVSMGGQQLPLWIAEPGTSPFVVELIALREVGIQGVSVDVGHAMPLMFSKAGEQFRRLLRPADRIASLIKVAIEAAASESFHEAFQEAARWEFGIRRDLNIDSSGKRRERAAEELNIHSATFRKGARWERFLLEEVARALEELQPPPSRNDDPRHNYIDRPKLNATQSELLATRDEEWMWNTRRRICIVGEPGTGKSWLAWSIVERANYVWIPADSIDNLMQAVVDALSDFGIDTMGANASLKHEFVKLLQRGDGPEIVVFDGVEDYRQLDFLPAKNRSLIVITSQVRPDDDMAPVLEVRSLEEDEAIALAQGLYPEADAEELGTLVKALGCRAIAVAQVSAYLHRRHGSVTVTEFLEVLEQDAILVLDSVTERTERTLKKVYRDTLDQLEKEAPESLVALETITFGSSGVAQSVIVAYLLGDALAVSSSRLRSELTFSNAVHPLRQLCLVEEASDGLSLHSLTRRIMASLLVRRGSTFLERWSQIWVPIMRTQGIALFPSGWTYRGALRFTWHGVESYFAYAQVANIPKGCESELQEIFDLNGVQLGRDSLRRRWATAALVKHRSWLSAGQPADYTVALDWVKRFAGMFIVTIELEERRDIPKVLDGDRLLEIVEGDQPNVEPMRMKGANGVRIIFNRETGDLSIEPIRDEK